MVNPNAKNPAPITSAAGASFGLTFATRAEYQKTLLFPQRNLLKKNTCVEKMNNSWMCSVTSALSNESQKTIRCGRYAP